MTFVWRIDLQFNVSKRKKYISIFGQKLVIPAILAQSKTIALHMQDFLIICDLK